MGADLLEVIHALVQRETNLNLAAIQNAKEVHFFINWIIGGGGVCVNLKNTTFHIFYLFAVILSC